MSFPALTALATAVLALYYAVLSFWVVAGRVGHQTLLGDGGDGSLQRRIRSHANFGEYVPLTLLVIALLEAGGGAHLLVQILLVILVIARVLHPIGMFAPVN